jgi:Protein of unknown function (DUF3298).
MKKFCLTLTALLLSALLLSACASEPQQPTPEPVAAQTPAPTPAPLYIFSDSTVQKTVETILGKPAESFTEKDLSALRQIRALRIENGLHSLNDVPVLFPNLRFLQLTFYEKIPENVYDTLAAVESLRVLEIYASVGFARHDFFQNCSYVNLRHSLNEPADNAIDMANYILVDSAAVFSEGFAVFQYTRYINDPFIFEVVDTQNIIPDTENDFGIKFHTESFLYIHRIIDGTLILVQASPVVNRIGNADGGFILVDVDFDGQEDVLVKNGHFGAQGAVTYSCFLQRDKAFVENESFSDIANPAVDAENQLILSTWRNWAASHSWAEFSYQKGAYVMTRKLTEELRADYLPDEEIWVYTEEARINGKMQTVSEIETRNYTDEEILEMFHAPESDWGLWGDKWRTLNNLGIAADFSIYSSGMPDTMTRRLIEADDVPHPTVPKWLASTTYPIYEKYYSDGSVYLDSKGGSYLELDLVLPRLAGDYPGIPAINAFFSGKEQFFYDELSFDTLVAIADSAAEAGRPEPLIEGRKWNIFREAHYRLTARLGNIVSFAAELDGGAYGVSWAGIEGNTFDLVSGKKLELADLFCVSEAEYMEAVIRQVAEIADARCRAQGGIYWISFPLSDEGIESLRYRHDPVDFYLTDQSLVIFYQKYVLSIGAAGPQEFEIPYESLTDILTEELLQAIRSN